MLNKKYEKKVEKIINELSLEEKASFCSGSSPWTTADLERLNIPQMMVADGPHGLRVVENPEELGAKSKPATCFPTASALASSWDRELLNNIGKALGKEAQSQDISILLGPGVNIKRTPLCGRNFEYFSEDPYLTGELALNLVQGIQSEGVGTCVKHFVCNNQETDRMTVNSRVDERSFREIYLKAFKKIVKEASPWSIMSAYNKINGTYASENNYLLNEILREEWNFSGIVISDWGAVNERVEGIKAGLDLEMPGPSPNNDKKIVEAVKNGELEETALDEVLKRILKIIFKAADSKKNNIDIDEEKHHQLARRSAADSMILLKNENDILPVDTENTESIAIIGRMAKNPKYQGSGSSRVNPFKIDNVLTELKKKIGNKLQIKYSEGYQENNFMNKQLLEDAVQTAGSVDTAILFVGLTEEYESEGYDREHLQLPEEHIKLIKKVAEVQPRSIVVLSNGAPVAMNSWLNKVPVVLESWLSGQGGGGAVADILLGEISPSGKLAETFPEKLVDNPAYLNFPGEKREVLYGERIFVGYRYFEVKEIKPLFPFGYGLSYTSFAYSGLEIDQKNINSSDSLEIKFTITNTGEYRGKEIAQVYICQKEPELLRPVKELKAFKKVDLKPGAEKEVKIILDGNDFGYYNSEFDSWITETDEYKIQIGSSSKDIRLEVEVNINNDKNLEKPLDEDSVLKRWFEDETGKEVLMEYLPGEEVEKFQTAEDDFADILMNIPLKKLTALSQGKITEDIIKEIVTKVKKAKES